VLGPLRVSANGQELQLGGPKQRSVLVLLLASGNRPVSIDRIIDGGVFYEDAGGVLRKYLLDLDALVELAHGRLTRTL
jgi:DNA-binding SARP family transcriptional activator